jgi:hypothetical protein
MAQLVLTIRDGMPPGLLDCDVRDLARLLGGPTLLHLPGRAPEPLFVSVLLHGNETTGFEAVRAILRRHGARPLPRPLSLFIGNVAAAQQDVRTLATQTDYNRAWPGTAAPGTVEAGIMAAVVEAMRARRPFASIDIHNNTGLNPHYACVSNIERPFLQLARLFSRVVVWFERPLGVQSTAMSALCPAVTVECGRIGTRDGVAHATEFLDASLHLSHFADHDVPARDIELLRTIAIVRVPGDVSISFDGSAADLRFRDDIDRLNFGLADAGTFFGTVARSDAQLDVIPGDERPLDGAWFTYEDGDIRLARPAVPAMLTRDVAAVRLDCLCYLMERVAVPGARPGQAQSRATRKVS